MKQVDDGTQLIREGHDGLEVSRDQGKTWEPGPEAEQWQKDAKDLLKHHGKEPEEKAVLESKVLQGKALGMDAPHGDKEQVKAESKQPSSTPGMAGPGGTPKGAPPPEEKSQGPGSGAGTGASKK